MAKLTPDSVLDLMLDVLIGDTVHLCSQQPTSYAQASTTYVLASQPIAALDVVISNGDVSGRKFTVTPPAGTVASNSGTPSHVAMTRGTDLLFVTTVSGSDSTAGETIDILPFSYELADVS